MEMADGIIINKADGNNLNKAKLARAQFQNALHLFPTPDSGWFPQVLTCSSTEKTGIPEVWDMVTEYMDFTKESGFFHLKRSRQAKYWMYETINETLKENFYNDEAIQQLLAENERKVLNSEISSFVAAKNMLDYYFGKK